MHHPSPDPGPLCPRVAPPCPVSPTFPGDIHSPRPLRRSHPRPRALRLAKDDYSVPFGAFSSLWLPSCAFPSHSLSSSSHRLIYASSFPAGATTWVLSLALLFWLP
ncbi:hypothetical protein B0H13DRAFT_2355195 [Mycena leptocephala]|nr:hypothetical protein B0H13DRAFT_2355195 [Mycena leptocephala]